MFFAYDLKGIKKYLKPGHPGRVHLTESLGLCSCFDEPVNDVVYAVLTLNAQTVTDLHTNGTQDETQRTKHKS